MSMMILFKIITPGMNKMILGIPCDVKNVTLYS